MKKILVCLAILGLFSTTAYAFPGTGVANSGNSYSDGNGCPSSAC